MGKAEINKVDLRNLEKKLIKLHKYSEAGLSQELGYTAAHIAKRASNKLTANKTVDTGQLRSSIHYGMQGKHTVEVRAVKKYAPYVEFGTGNAVDLSELQALGINPSYAQQFKGKGFTGKRPVKTKKGWRMIQFPIHLKPRPFFFNSVREELPIMLTRIEKKLKNLTK